MATSTMTIPATYARLILECCETLGIPTPSAAQRLNPVTLKDPAGRMPLPLVGELLFEAFSHNEAISYELGLATQLTTHGFVGYGLLTHPTVGEALEFGLKNTDLRTPFVALSLQVEQDTASITVRESFDLGPTRRVSIEHFLIGIWRIAELLYQTTGSTQSEFRLSFDYPQPACHSRYSHRLPPCQFSAPTNRLSFPAHYLALELATADRTAVNIVLQQCAKERAQVGTAVITTTKRVNQLLDQLTPLPSLDRVASHLNMSTRSLKRKLQREGSSFRNLVDAYRISQARQLLHNPGLRISDIATQLGYTAPANFTRAFRKWTGLSPLKLRQAYLDEGKTSAPLSPPGA